MRQLSEELNTTTSKQVALRYLLWLPDNSAEQAAEPWPLIMFLHGRGERGANLRLVQRHGLARKLTEGFQLPALVAAPQCPDDSDWTLQDDAVLALIDELCQRYPVDQQRLYLTGLSMGGRGTWRLAAAHPQRFAAIVPICGRRPDGLRDTKDAQKLCQISMWVFHGADDQVVPASESDALVAALQPCNTKLRYTRYPDLGHDSWTRAYDEPELYTWLLSQHRAAL